jgi:plastocyanin
MTMPHEPGAIVVSAAPSSFAPRIVIVPKGSTARFTQMDPLYVHNVIALDGGSNGAPLFSAPTLGFGESATIAGVSRLPAGDYPFSCSVHEQMYGVLMVR